MSKNGWLEMIGMLACIAAAGGLTIWTAERAIASYESEKRLARLERQIMETVPAEYFDAYINSLLSRVDKLEKGCK